MNNHSLSTRTRSLLLCLYLVIVFSILGSCTSSKLNSIQERKIPMENGSLSVYFCPQDPCDLILNAELNKSTERVYCAWYDLDLPATQVLLNDLTTQERIDVKVVVDNNNPLIDPLFSVQMDTSDALMHNKFCVVDSSVVIMGSMNPTENDAYHNNNNLLVIHSRYLAENYETEFRELWSGSFGKGKSTPYPDIVLNNSSITNLFCPEDQCEARIVSELQKANHSVTFMTFTFTSPKIGNLLIQKAEAGCIVSGIFEKFTNKYSQYYLLSKVNTTLPLHVSFDSSTDLLHHKVFIIDNSMVITGSYNPTKAANEENDENLLIIRNSAIAELYLSEYERLTQNERSIEDS